MKKVLIALVALQLVAACASSPQMTREERIEWYRANAGEPVRSFFYSGHLRGWTALDERSIALWTRSNEAFLIEFFPRCLLYTSPSPRDGLLSRMPSSA